MRHERKQFLWPELRGHAEIDKRDARMQARFPICTGRQLRVQNALRYPNQLGIVVLTMQIEFAKINKEFRKWQKHPKSHTAKACRWFNCSSGSPTMLQQNVDSRSNVGVRPESRIIAQYADLQTGFVPFHPISPCRIGVVPVAGNSA